MSANLIDDLKKSAWDLYGEINDTRQKKQKKALTALLYNTGSLSVDDVLALASIESNKDTNFSKLFLAFIWSTESYQKRLVSVINGKNSALGAQAFQTLIDYTLQDENKSLGTKILENKITQKNLLEKKPFQALFNLSDPANKNNRYFDEVLSSSRQFSAQAKKLKEKKSTESEDLSLSSQSPQKISKPASKRFFAWSFMDVIDFIYSYFFGDAVKNASPQKRVIASGASKIIGEARPRKPRENKNQTPQSKEEEIEESTVISPPVKPVDLISTTPLVKLTPQIVMSTGEKNPEKNPAPVLITPESIKPSVSASAEKSILDTPELKPISPSSVSSDVQIINKLMTTPEHNNPSRLNDSLEDYLTATPEHVVPVSPFDASESPECNLLETPPDINMPVSSPASESGDLLNTPEHNTPEYNSATRVGFCPIAFSHEKNNENKPKFDLDKNLEDDPLFNSPGMH